MSEKYFYFAFTIDWQFGWIQNAVLAIIFLQNFEGIASLLSSCFCCEVPNASDSSSFIRSQGFCFYFVFSGHLPNLFVPDVSQCCVLLCAFFHPLCQAAGTSFLLEIHGLQFWDIFLHCCVDEFLPSLSLFSLSGTVTKILDLLDQPSNFLFFSLFSFLKFFTVLSGICHRFFSKSLLNVLFLLLFFCLQGLLNFL